MEKILIVLPVEERHREMFKKAAPEAELIYCLADQVTKEQAQEANVIIGNVPREYLKDSPNLRWIQLNNAGTEGFCDPGVLPEGTLLTNASGAYGMAISEHLIAMLFMIQKHLGVYRDQQKEHLWIKQEPMLVTEGSTVLVLGLGDIGSYVIGVRRTLREKPDYVDELYTMEALSRLLPRADVVALSLPGYAATRGVIGKEELDRMKPGAVLLNVGRGTAVDTNALSDALYAGKLAGAGLDVTDPEPLPADHPIWDAPGALITPHVSGGYALKPTLEKILALSARNLERYEKGETLENMVDLTTGYAKR